jgi:hypothetical protein
MVNYIPALKTMRHNTEFVLVEAIKSEQFHAVLLGYALGE